MDGDSLFFNNNDPSDSEVSITSTAASEVREQYLVDRILAEIEIPPDSPDGSHDALGSQPELHYLVKWTGYPIWRSTWEPVDNFSSQACLREWEVRKLQEHQGLEDPFDVDAFEEQVEQQELRKHRRKARRAKKRRLVEAKEREQKADVAAAGRRQFQSDRPRKGHAAIALESASDSPAVTGSTRTTVAHVGKDSITTPCSPHTGPHADKHHTSSVSASDDGLHLLDVLAKRKRKERSPPLPKEPTKATTLNVHNRGVVKKAKRAVSNSPSPPPASFNNTQDSLYSLFHETLNGPVSKEPSAPIPLRAVEDKQRSEKPKASTQPLNLGGVSNTTATTTGGSEASSQAGSAPKPKNLGISTIFQNWDTNKKRDSRGSRFNSPTTTLDSAGLGFTNMSHQNNVQKWANSERIPADISALKTWNPQTGKYDDGPELATARPADSHVRQPVLRVDTNVGHQASASSSVRSASRNNPLSILATDDNASNRFVSTKAKVQPQAGLSSASKTEERPVHAFSVSRPRPKDMACRFWMRGTCRLREEDCKHAHAVRHTIAGKKRFPCKFFNQSGCQFSSELCEFLHISAEEFRSGQKPWEHLQRRESPDISGCRQDEAERIVQSKKAVGRVSISTPGAGLSEPQTSRTGDPTRFPLHPEKPKTLPVPSDTELAGGKPLLADDPGSFGKREGHVDNIEHTPEETNLEMVDLADKTAKLLVNPQGNSPIFMTVRLSFDSQPRLQTFVPIKENAELKAKEICLARDFQRYFPGDNMICASGDMVADETCSDSTDDTLDSFTDYLVLNAAGAIIRQNGFFMVVYPRHTPANDWGFMKASKISSAALRFHVLPTTQGFEQYHTPTKEILKPDTTPLAAICKAELALDRSVLFQGPQRYRLDKTVFLMFPSHSTLEVQLLTVYLLEMGAKVFHADVPGAWEEFGKQLRDKGEDFSKSGVILFHPSMDQYWKIPFFRFLLFRSCYNFFQLGKAPSLAYHPEATKSYSCVRLFPFGALWLLTDDVLEHRPRAALKILERFHDGIKRKPVALKQDRFVTRPGVKDWLVDITDKYSGKEADNIDRHKLLLVVLKLLRSTDGRKRHAIGELPLIVSPPVQELPSYPAMWDRDEESATEWLVEWFAGRCIMERERFRRFCVIFEQSSGPEQTPGVGSEKDPKGWTKKWTHIRVTNPTRWLDTGGKG